MISLAIKLNLLNDEHTNTYFYNYLENKDEPDFYENYLQRFRINKKPDIMEYLNEVNEKILSLYDLINIENSKEISEIIITKLQNKFREKNDFEVFATKVYENPNILNIFYNLKKFIFLVKKNVKDKNFKINNSSDPNYLSEIETNVDLNNIFKCNSSDPFYFHVTKTFEMFKDMIKILKDKIVSLLLNKHSETLKELLNLKHCSENNKKISEMVTKINLLENKFSHLNFNDISLELIEKLDYINVENIYCEKSMPLNFYYETFDVRKFEPSYIKKHISWCRFLQMEQTIKKERCNNFIFNIVKRIKIEIEKRRKNEYLKFVTDKKEFVIFDLDEKFDLHDFLKQNEKYEEYIVYCYTHNLLNSLVSIRDGSEKCHFDDFVFKILTNKENEKFLLDPNVIEYFVSIYSSKDYFSIYNETEDSCSSLVSMFFKVLCSIKMIENKENTTLKITQLESFDVEMKLPKIELPKKLSVFTEIVDEIQKDNKYKVFNVDMNKTLIDFDYNNKNYKLNFYEYSLFMVLLKINDCTKEDIKKLIKIENITFDELFKNLDNMLEKGIIKEEEGIIQII